MTEPMNTARRTEITDALAAIPAGPWHWIGDLNSGPTLATQYGGWKYVMGFRRLGTNGAQPCFPVPVEPHGHALLTPARDLIVPRAAYDPRTFRGINHPVARFIEHSAQFVAELLAENERLRGELAEQRQISAVLDEYAARQL
jgi:hypothetical protein